MSHVLFTHCTLGSFWGARLYFTLINQRLGVLKWFFWLVDARREMSSKCRGLASQQGDIPRVWRCHCSQFTSQLLNGVANLKKKTYGRLIHRHPHLEFLQEWAEKDFRRIGNWQEKPHWSSLAPFLHGCDAWLLPQWQLQSPGCPWTLLAAMLFLEGKGAAVSSPAQSRETFLLCLYWNDPSWWLKIGLRRWRGRTAQEKIGWPMFNQAALKCT